MSNDEKKKSIHIFNIDYFRHPIRQPSTREVSMEHEPVPIYGKNLPKSVSFPKERNDRWN